MGNSQPSGHAYAPYPDARVSRYSPAYYAQGAPAPRYRESYYAPENHYDERKQYEAARAVRRSLEINPLFTPNLGYTPYTAAQAAYVQPEHHDGYFYRNQNGWTKVLIVGIIGFGIYNAVEHDRRKHRTAY